MADTYNFCVQAAGAFDQAFLTIENKDYATPLSRVVVRKLDAEYPPEFNIVYSGSTPLPLQVQRVSAYGGGFDQTASIVGARSNSTPASQIKLIANPARLTVTSILGSRFNGRSTFTGPEGAMQALGNSLAGTYQEFLQYKRTSKSAAFLPVQIRAGEGLAFSYAGAITASINAATDRTTFLLVFTDGTNTFTAAVESPALRDPYCHFVLFNETGSAVTLTVLNVSPVNRPVVNSSLTYIAGVPRDPLENYFGDATGSLPQNSGLCATFAYLLCDSGPSPTGGNDVTLAGHRSNAASLSGKVEVKEGSFLRPLECDWDTTGIRKSRGHSETTTPPGGLFNNWPQCCVGGPTVAPGRGLLPFLMTGNKVLSLRRRMHVLPSVSANSTPFNFALGIFGLTASEVSLAPGQKLLILPFGNCGFADLVITGAIEYMTMAGASYPAVGDVDSGVQYGPNATNYTGTLEQPAITDVLSGVQYGAGGTEFTGTATGGGGGNTYSRGRITNA